jgi:hypothetical protein
MAKKMPNYVKKNFHCVFSHPPAMATLRKSEVPTCSKGGDHEVGAVRGGYRFSLKNFFPALVWSKMYKHKLSTIIVRHIMIAPIMILFFFNEI